MRDYNRIIEVGSELEEATRYMNVQVSAILDIFDDENENDDYEGMDKVERMDAYMDGVLELSKETTNHRQSTTTWRLLLTCGGPHADMMIEANENGSIESMTYNFQSGMCSNPTKIAIHNDDLFDAISTLFYFGEC